jgi:peptidoglycan-N-acetylglucosamine deacetylase
MRAAPIWAMPVQGDAPVALTFDDGPDPGTTLEVVDVLVAHGVTATFFVVAELALRYPEPVLRALGAGMEIGLHGWDHVDLAGQPAASVAGQLERSLEAIRKLGADPHLFRPAYGSLDDVIVETAAACGLATVNWSVNPEDWTRPGAGVIADRVAQAVEPGAIVMLHDGGGDRSQTVAALPVILDHFTAAGLTVVDLLGQLLG